MSRNSFRDPITGVLKAHGSMQSNGPSDLVQVEVDNFNLEPGKWRWNGLSWESYVSPEILRQQEFDTAVNADTVIQSLKSMTNAQYDAWFDANITTAADARLLLKRILRILIRRVL